MTTFAYQDSLKKLPIPPIEETCAKYLDVLKPLQNEREHQRTVAAVQEFLKSGMAHNLDAELRRYAELRNSYIEQFWYDSYLNYDSPVVLNLNPFFLLEDDPFNNESMCRNPQVKRAASLTLSSLKFVRALRNETLPVDKLRNGQPLCMYQYTKLFGASRIPTEDGCIMQSDATSSHIVVISKSQFYWFDVIDSDNHIMLLEQELVVNFTSIVHDSAKSTIDDVAQSSFGVLTTENRRIWAKIRNSKAITANDVNKEILSVIDSSLFVVCLDDVTMDNLSELAQNMLCGTSKLDKGVQVGTCSNRWYDKLQVIVTRNGKAGINFEHTGVDGHTVLRFVSDIYTDSILSFAQLINGNSPSLWKEPEVDSTRGKDKTAMCTVPRKLEWELTPDLSLALRFGETRLSDLINQNEFKHLEFKNYGSSAIKKMKYSPDAFVQMAFQATYYALYGKVECTYEPAMTKQFFHGRTEAVRTVSQESNLFVRKFFDHHVDDKSKLKYLLDACKKHTEQTKEALVGHGVDRHLYALFCIWKRYASEDDDYTSEEMDSRFRLLELTKAEESILTINGFEDAHTTASSSDETMMGVDARMKELPSIFDDPGWDRLNNTTISTSNCGNPSLRLFGFGPVSPNGFGLAYIIKDDLVSICAVSKHRQTDRFLVTLETYLNEVYRLFKEANVTGNSQAAAVAVSLPAPVLLPVPMGTPTPTQLNRQLTALLGGYGYFDMGDNDIKSRGQSPEPPFMNRNNNGFSLRDIGKKLRLSEY